MENVFCVLSIKCFEWSRLFNKYLPYLMLWKVATFYAGVL